MNLKTLKITENNQKQQEYCIFTLLKTQKKKIILKLFLEKKGHLLSFYFTLIIY